MIRNSKQRFRSKAERLKDQLKASELMLKDMNQSEIARELDLSEATIRRDIKTISEKWNQKATKNINYYINKQLELINLISKEGWSAWDASKKDSEGDPRYMGIIQWAAEQISKLFKLERAMEKLLVIEEKNEIIITDAMIQRMSKAIAFKVREKQEQRRREIEEKNQNITNPEIN